MIKEISHKAFTEHYDQRRQTEQYQRAIKKGFNIKHFQVRSKGAIKYYLFAVIPAFVQLQKLSAIALINNRYSLQRNLFNHAMTLFVDVFMSSMARTIQNLSQSSMHNLYLR